MCGIAGIWEIDGKRVSIEAIRQVTTAISHRGPDSEGIEFYLDGSLALGHRRLAILDLTASGQQPMSFGDRRYWIVYNGEIYNFIELRQELEGLGYRFRSESDTEVILAAFHRWGPDCQLRFNGMWAFAILDQLKQSLFLSRDRFGVKPLFFLHTGKRFVFASELKAFLHLDGFSVEANDEALRRTLANPFGLEGTETTLLQGVKRLLGGHHMFVSKDGVRMARWWNTLDHLHEVPRTFDEQSERFRELFIDACRLRLRSDVRIGTALSGGIDSTAVVSSLSAVGPSSSGDRVNRDWQRAYVASFPGTPLDESEFASMAAAHVAITPSFVDILPEDALSHMEELIYQMEDVYITPFIAAWQLYREMRRQKVFVSLDGHGADEMLGGYQHDLRGVLTEAGSYSKAPLRTLDLVRTLYGMYPKDGPVARPNLIQIALSSDPTVRTLARVARSVGLYSKVGPSGKPWGLKREPEPWHDDKADPDESAAIDQLGPLSSRLYRAFHYSVLPTILRNFDRSSMAHGVEVRMPFMDWRLVCFSFSLGDRSKVGRGYTKRILRQSMRGIMPESIRSRRGKIGLNAPLPEWFASSMREWLWALVNERDFQESDLWDGPVIRSFVEQKRREGSWDWFEAERLWPFVHAYLWRRMLGRTNATA